jgi:hypothetical protein
MYIDEGTNKPFKNQKKNQTFKRKHSENVLLSFTHEKVPIVGVSILVFNVFLTLTLNISYLDAISIIFRVQWVFYSVVEKPAFTAFSG